MKFKSKPGPKIPTTQKNTNKKKEVNIAAPEKQYNTSLIKKNEFALILLGALLLTVVIFFVFFRGPGEKKAETISQTPSPSYEKLEQRIAELEKRLIEINTTPAAGTSVGPGQKKDLIQLEQRVKRLEAALSLKFDSVMDRLGSMERKLSGLAQKAPASPAPAKTAVKPKSASKPKAAAAAPAKKQVFHTVKKGETLYSISKKYNTTVPALRKLNKLSATAKIFPGDNILIK